MESSLPFNFMNFEGLPMEDQAKLQSMLYGPENNQAMADGTAEHRHVFNVHAQVFVPKFPVGEPVLVPAPVHVAHTMPNALPVPDPHSVMGHSLQFGHNLHMHNAHHHPHLAPQFQIMQHHSHVGQIPHNHNQQAQIPQHFHQNHVAHMTPHDHVQAHLHQQQLQSRIHQQPPNNHQHYHQHIHQQQQQQLQHQQLQQQNQHQSHNNAHNQYNNGNGVNRQNFRDVPPRYQRNNYDNNNGRQMRGEWNGRYNGRDHSNRRITVLQNPTRRQNQGVGPRFYRQNRDYRDYNHQGEYRHDSRRDYARKIDQDINSNMLKLQNGLEPKFDPNVTRDDLSDDENVTVSLNSGSQSPSSVKWPSDASNAGSPPSRSLSPASSHTGELRSNMESTLKSDHIEQRSSIVTVDTLTKTQEAIAALNMDSVEDKRESMDSEKTVEGSNGNDEGQLEKAGSSSSLVSLDGVDVNRRDQDIVDVEWTQEFQNVDPNDEWSNLEPQTPWSSGFDGDSRSDSSDVNQKIDTNGALKPTPNGPTSVASAANQTEPTENLQPKVDNAQKSSDVATMNNFSREEQSNVSTKVSPTHSSAGASAPVDAKSGEIKREDRSSSFRPPVSDRVVSNDPKTVDPRQKPGQPNNRQTNNRQTNNRQPSPVLGGKTVSSDDAGQMDAKSVPREQSNAGEEPKPSAKPAPTAPKTAESQKSTPRTSPEPKPPTPPAPPVSTDPPKPPAKSWAALVRHNLPASSQPPLVIRDEPQQGMLIKPAEIKKNDDQEEEELTNPGSDKLVRKLKDFVQRTSLLHRPPSVYPRGLINRANWCYVNATLQALLACPPLYNLFRSMPRMNIKDRGQSCTPVIDSIVEFVHQFSFMKPLSSRRKQEAPSIQTQEPFEPDYVYSMLMKLKSTDAFKQGRQEDAEEFLTCVLNHMHEEMVAILGNGNNNSPNSANDANDDDQNDDWEQVGRKKKAVITRSSEMPRSLVSDIFCGQIRSVLRSSGARESATLEPFFTLPLDIQQEKIRSVKDALTGLVSRESIQGFTCSKTKEEVEASRCTMLESLPPVLVLHLKCFIYDTNGGCQKLNKDIEYTVDLEINKDIISPNARAKMRDHQRSYKLFAVVYHRGKTLQGGHYTTDVYHSGINGWIRIDDHNINVVPVTQVLKYEQPYMPYLLYYRRHDSMVPDRNTNRS